MFSSSIVLDTLFPWPQQIIHEDSQVRSDDQTLLYRSVLEQSYSGRNGRLTVSIHPSSFTKVPCGKLLQWPQSDEKTPIVLEHQSYILEL